MPSALSAASVGQLPHRWLAISYFMRAGCALTASVQVLPPVVELSLASAAPPAAASPQQVQAEAEAEDAGPCDPAAAVPAGAGAGPGMPAAGALGAAPMPASLLHVLDTTKLGASTALSAEALPPLIRDALTLVWTPEGGEQWLAPGGSKHGSLNTVVAYLNGLT